jgi:hypothetical protein
MCLPRPRGRHRLASVQVVGGGDGDDIDLRRLQQVVVSAREPRPVDAQAGGGEPLARPALVAGAERHDPGVGVLLKC